MKDLPNDASATLLPGEIRIPPGLVMATASDNGDVIREATPGLCDFTGFDRDALIGARNETFRHSDMPKDLIDLMTLRLNQGRPACGYLKYRTASGGHYWAFVTVIATDDRHVSIRVRPNSALLDKVSAVYDRLATAERDGLGARPSANELEDGLEEIGFAEYGDFERASMREEFSHFACGGGETPDVLPKLDALDDLLATAEELVNRVDRDFATVRGEPVNMRILAGHMEGSSGALGTISQNYDVMASEMQQLLTRLRCPDAGAMGRIRRALDQARFGAQLEVFLRHAAAQVDVDAATGLAEIARHLKNEQPAARTEIAAAALLVPDTCRQLRHRIIGLNVVKLLCRVESGRMPTADGGLDGIIARLERFHQSTETNLAALSSIADQIKSACAAL